MRRDTTGTGDTSPWSQIVVVDESTTTHDAGEGLAVLQVLSPVDIPMLQQFNDKQPRPPRPRHTEKTGKTKRQRAKNKRARKARRKGRK